MCLLPVNHVTDGERWMRIFHVTWARQHGRQDNKHGQQLLSEAVSCTTGHHRQVRDQSMIDQGADQPVVRGSVCGVWSCLEMPGSGRGTEEENRPTIALSQHPQL